MGNIYFIKGENSFYKIGKANDVNSRLSGINTSSHQTYQIVISKLVENPLLVEAELHEKYKQYKIKSKNEWFEFTPEIAIQVCIEISNNIKGIEIRSENKQLRSIESKIDRLFLRIQKLKDFEELDLLTSLLSFNKEQKLKRFLNQPKKALVIRQDNDENLIKSAKELISKTKIASASYLQTNLKIGYARASRLMQLLESDGSIASPSGYGRRKVNI